MRFQTCGGFQVLGLLVGDIGVVAVEVDHYWHQLVVDHVAREHVQGQAVFGSGGGSVRIPPDALLDVESGVVALVVGDELAVVALVQRDGQLGVLEPILAQHWNSVRNASE